MNKIIIGSLLLSVLAFGQDKKQMPPKVAIHSTKKSDGSYNTSASCPKGWKVYLSQADMDEYNNGDREPSDMINLLAKAVCVVKTNKDKEK